jgi:hypothetical protein
MGWYRLGLTDATPGQDNRCVKETLVPLFLFVYYTYTTGQSDVMMAYLTSNHVPLGHNTGKHLKRLPVPERRAGISILAVQLLALCLPMPQKFQISLTKALVGFPPMDHSQRSRPL